MAEASRRTADDLYFDAVVEGIEARKEESAVSSETDDKDATTGEGGPSSGTSPTEDVSVGDDESDSESMSPAVSAALSAAAAVGPRAASAILLATAHPDPVVSRRRRGAPGRDGGSSRRGGARGGFGRPRCQRRRGRRRRAGFQARRWSSQVALQRGVCRTRDAFQGGGHARRVARRREGHRMDQKTPLSAAADEGRETGGAQVVHRSSHRLQTSRRLRDERRKRRRAPSVHAYDMWKGHVAIYCAAARPRYYDSTQRSGDPKDDDDADDEGTKKTNKKKKETVNVEDAVDAAVAEDEEEETGEKNFDDDEKFDDLEACFDSEQVLRWAWTRCAAAAGASAELGENKDDEARLRKEVMIDALAAARAALPLGARRIPREGYNHDRTKAYCPCQRTKKSCAPGRCPALNRASAGLVILRRLADRIIERDLPRSEAILSRVWAAADAWLEPLSAVTDEALAPTFDQTDACASAANEAAALLKLRHSHAPPAEIDATDAAAKSLAHSLPSKQASVRWYEFVATVLEAVDVVVDKQISKKRADLVIKRVARASKVDA